MNLMHCEQLHRPEPFTQGLRVPVSSKAAGAAWAGQVARMVQAHDGPPRGDASKPDPLFRGGRADSAKRRRRLQKACYLLIRLRIGHRKIRSSHLSDPTGGHAAGRAILLEQDDEWAVAERR